MKITEAILPKGGVLKLIRYSLWKDQLGRVWIEHDSGEGSQFETKDIDKLIHNYYRKHF